MLHQFGKQLLSFAALTFLTVTLSSMVAQAAPIDFSFWDVSGDSTTTAGGITVSVSGSLLVDGDLLAPPRPDLLGIDKEKTSTVIFGFDTSIESIDIRFQGMEGDYDLIHNFSSAPVAVSGPNLFAFGSPINEIKGAAVFDATKAPWDGVVSFTGIGSNTLSFTMTSELLSNSQW